MTEQPRKKYSILEWIIRKLRKPEEPATKKEIAQLELNYRRAELKANIAEAKHKERSHSRFSNFVSSMNKKIDNHSRTTKQRKSKRQSENTNDSNLMTKDPKKMIYGDNNKKGRPKF